MKFELSEEQKLIQQAARDFARAEIQPIAAQYDREARFPMEIMDKAREVGLVNVTIPTAYGGSGLGVLELTLVTQELAWACAGINGTLGLNCVIADVFHVAGSAEQKEQVFGRLNAGEFEDRIAADKGSRSVEAQRVFGGHVVDMRNGPFPYQGGLIRTQHRSK